jgi:hypothetical protein
LDTTAGHTDVSINAPTRGVSDQGVLVPAAQLDTDPTAALADVGTNAGETAPGPTISGSGDLIPAPNTWHEYEGLPEHFNAPFRAALDKEWTSILDHGTFRPTRIQEAKMLTPRIISTRWLFKVKVVLQGPLRRAGL